MKKHRSGQRLRRQVRQRQRLGLGLGQRAVRQGHPAHGRAGQPAQHLPLQHPGPADLVRGARHRAGLAGPARRRRPDGRHEPADLGPGRVKEIAPAATCSTIQHASRMPAVEVPRRHHRHRHAADRDLQRAPTPTRASASCSRTSSTSARCRCCWTSTRRSIEKLGEQYKGKESCSTPTCKALQPGPRLRPRHLPCPIWPAKVARADARRRPHLRRRQQRAALGCGLWRRHGVRLVPDHAVVLGGRGLQRYCKKLRASRRPATRATPSCRPRTNWPPSAWSSAPAGTARAPSPPPPARASR
jgi:hypothetical protein